MNKEIYSKVIDRLLSGDLNYKKIVIELAKQEPEIFLEISGSPVEQILPVDTVKQIVSDIKSNQMIKAIQELRTAMNLGLGEARDIIYVATDRDDVFLNSENTKMCEEIKIAMQT